VQYGKLILWLSYDQSQYCKEEMDLLSRVYYAKLIDIITHCCDAERIIITLSDVSDEVISEDDFGKIISSFEFE
ncbi:MAG: hypothetical protein FWE43_04370, partial [Streptococcaceae bacterium]|nr:hypothetical protein [Streptococcaceae bacterium]